MSILMLLAIINYACSRISRMATGENWQDIMLSCLPGQDCEVEGGTDCGSDFAYVFFPTFYFISSIIVSVQPFNLIYTPVE